MSFHAFLKRLALSLPAAVSAQPLLADSSIDQTPFEEIIVTADFYQASALNLPTSVTVLDPNAISQRKAEHLEQLLGLAPNVNYATGASRGRFIQIRGIGERSEFIEPVNYSVGVLIDGIDFTGISTAASTLDIQQVEILRGPQGTLYGANALAGLINMVSAGASTQTQASLEASLGNYNSRTLKGAVGGPLMNNLGYRIAAQSTQSDGFIENSFLNREDTNNMDEQTFRGKISWLASGDLSMDLTAFYADVDNGYEVFNYESTRTTRSNQPGHDRQETTAFALSSKYSMSETGQLETLLSVADSNVEYGYDEDWRNPELCIIESCIVAYNQEGQPIAGQDGYHSAFDNYQRDNNNTHLDVRLKSGNPNAGSNRVIGLYYRDQSVDLARTYSSGYGDCCDVFFTSNYQTENLALYGDWSTKVSERLSYSLGARIERRDAAYADSDAFGFATSETLWGAKFSLRYQIRHNQMAYATLSRGYKPGGANSNSSVPDEFREYDTETLVNYELGLKGYFFDGSLQLQTALFLQDRSDIQTDSAIVNCPGNGTPCRFNDYLTNAASGQNYGLESQLSYALSDSTRLYASLGLLSATYSSGYTNFQHVNADEENGRGVDMNGRHQPHAPSYQFVVGIDAALTEELRLNLNLEGKDDFLFANDHDVRASSFVLLNTNLGYTRDQWSASIWAKNLGDQGYQNRAFGSFGNDPRDGYSTPGPYFQPGDPRTFGITGRYNF